MNWTAFLESLEAHELERLKTAVDFEFSRRNGEIVLSPEEQSMGMMECIRSVRNRLNLDLVTAKKFVEHALGGKS